MANYDFDLFIMDFLDPKKQQSHVIRLIVGYVLVGIAILIATIILLYQAYGFGLDKDGEVVQNGLIFMSSQPSSADVFVNDKLYKSATNTRMQLEEGKYNIKLQRDGYRPWQRTIDLMGGSVAHFDYPLLFPTKMTPANVKEYAASPNLVSQSPDRRWLVVNQPGAPLNFDLYDLKTPKDVSAAVTTITLPESIVTSPNIGENNWKVVEWSTNNRHVLLMHTYNGGTEYIMLDRSDPTLSFNVTKTFNLGPTQQLALRDKKFDLYYVYDTAAKTIQTLERSNPQVVTPALDRVLSYKPYGSNKILYVTDKDAPPGKVIVFLRDGDATYKIRELSALEGPYLTDMAEYDNDWYIAVGASGESKVYVYKNPQKVRKSTLTSVLVPVRTLKVPNPSYLAFSSNTRFVMIQGGAEIAVYDAETNNGYDYALASPVDPPLTNATWMDGHRLTYVSGGKVTVIDYDNLNSQSLVPAKPGFIPVFDRDYKYVYALAPAANPANSVLTQSSLLTPKDL